MLEVKNKILAMENKYEQINEKVIIFLIAFVFVFTSIMHVVGYKLGEFDSHPMLTAKNFSFFNLK